MAELPAQPFRVVYSGLVQGKLSEWAGLARPAGLAPSLQEALVTIDRCLHSDPLAWGEASKKLRDANLIVCCGFHARILVRYGVDEQRRIVYVVECELLPGHPLKPTAGS